jgi:hypothetical protein
MGFFWVAAALGLIVLSAPLFPMLATTPMQPQVGTPCPPSTCSPAVHAASIIWQNPKSPQRCTPGESQAVPYRYRSEFGTEGCTSTWLNLNPWTDNLTEAVDFVKANRAQFAGAFINDFGFGLVVNHKTLPAYRALSKLLPTCPVLYPQYSQPNVTLGAPCIVIAVQPNVIGDMGDEPASQMLLSTAEWSSAISGYLSSVDAQSVWLLAYNSPSSFWPYPVPPNYLIAMTSAAVNVSGLVLWH